MEYVVYEFILAHWQAFLVGIITAAFCYAVGLIFKYFINIARTKSISKLLGNYNLYCYHTDGSDSFIHCKVKISRKLKGIGVVIQSINGKYYGRLEYSGTNIYLIVRSPSHGESMQIIFYKPLYFNNLKLWGIGTCITLQGQPVALRFLLSESDIGEVELESLFSSLKGFTFNHGIVSRQEYDEYSGVG